MVEQTRRKRCPSCGDLFSPMASTGRPRKFCSQRCQRFANHEVKRLGRRLERFENQRDELAINLHDPVKFADGQSVRQRYDALCRLIDGLKQRLLVILEDSEVK